MKRKNINIQIGRNLRKARKEVKLTQQIVAEKLGIERSVYTRYETGDIEIPVTTFALICRLIGADPTEILEDVEI